MRCVVATPLGPYAIAAEDGAITRVQPTQEALHPPEDKLLTEAARQLHAYFEGALTAFSLPLNPKGTAFQRACWAELTRIPYGKVISYGEEAKRIGKPNACRAVGGANGRNPIHILIPCHRVVGADGALTGYAGHGENGLRIKLWLLEHEQKVIHNS